MKYTSLLLFAIFCLLESTNAQYPPQQDSIENKIFTKVEVEAEFVGGFEEWKNYLMKNLNLGKVSDLVLIPKGKKELKQTIIVKFIVDKEGNISEVSVDNPEAEPNCIEEAIRIIKTSPKWVPAKQNGRIVKAYRRQPITFVFHR